MRAEKAAVCAALRNPSEHSAAALKKHSVPASCWGAKSCLGFNIEHRGVIVQIDKILQLGKHFRGRNRIKGCGGELATMDWFWGVCLLYHCVLLQSSFGEPVS